MSIIRIRSIMICACVIVFSLSCGGKSNVLHIYNWADYMKPELLTRFEKDFKCKVVLDNYDSNEGMYAKIKAGATGYDIIFPSGYMTSIMYSQGMISDIDKRKIANIKNIDPDFLARFEDREMKYSVPYSISFSGVGYNKQKIKNPPHSWSVFANPAYKGRMTLLNDMRETIGAALKHLGYSYNTVDEKELGKAKELIMKWKTNMAKFDVDEAKRGLATGEFYLIHQYNGDIMQIMAENENVSFFIPEEGTSFSYDGMVIPKTAPNPELAYKFINYMLDPAISAENMTFTSYLAPNAEAIKLIDKSLRDNPIFLPPKSILKKCDPLKDLGDKNVLYTRVWDEIKASK